MKFCTKCGAQIPEESKFCVICGKPTAEETPKPVAAKKKKNWKLAVILILIGVLLIGCGGAVIAGEVNLFGLLGIDNADDEKNDNNDKDKGNDKTNDEDNEKPREKGTIAVIAKGELHAYWQAVRAGAFDAAAAHGYKVTFQGPASESPSEIPNQIAMLQSALSREDIQAIVLATIGTGFEDELIEAYDRGIPVVEFDSGIWADDVAALESAGKDPTIGSVATDNKLLGALAAENFYNYLKTQNDFGNGYKVGVIQWDSTTTQINRTEGFVEKITELAANDGIALQINLQEGYPNSGAYRAGLVELEEWGVQAVFMTNEGVVNEVYSAITDDVDTYKHILFCGVDAGTSQYNWIKDAGKKYPLLVGSVAPDSYSIGYEAVMMAIAKLEGKAVADVGIAGVWCNAENIDMLKDQSIFYMG